MTSERFIVDDAGTLIDLVSRDTYDYVDDVCPVCNKLWEQTNRFAQYNKELSDEKKQLKQLLNEAEDIILCQTTPHYQRQWENIKRNVKGDVE